MMNIPPHNCSICYQSYNNDRSPLILITCGHTFCRECLEMIFNDDTKEISCPECKQSTYILEPKSLPKNRSLLDVIIYHEEINRNAKKNSIYQDKRTVGMEKFGRNVNLEMDFSINLKNLNLRNFKNSEKFLDDNNDKTKNLLFQYANILNKLEETYNRILDEHRYLTEISEVLVTREVDEVLDNLIDIINDHRNNLQAKIRSEFQKVNLIRDFRNSLNMYKNKLEIYMNKIFKMEKQELEGEDMKIKNVTTSIKKETKEGFAEKENSREFIEKEGIVNIEDRGSADNHLITNYDKNISDENKMEIGNQENLISIQPCSLNNNNSLPENLSNFSFSEFESQNLISEIKFAELYAITLKSYSKEIYNPSKYFFINKFQTDKLTEDLKKLLFKVCDYDENVYKYNLDSLNSPDEKKILKEIQDSCDHSDYRKLRYIFSHFRINPNFIYSEVLDHISYQNIADRDAHFTNSSNFNSLNNSLTINLAGSNTNSNPYMGFPTIASNNIATTSISQSNNLFGNAPRTNQIQQNSVFRGNSNHRINFTDKIYNLYSYLKNFKDKNELSELLKFLIEEYNYLPLKLDVDTTVDIKFGKDFEWKINLNLI